MSICNYDGDFSSDCGYLIDPYEGVEFYVTKGGFFTYGHSKGVVKSADPETGEIKAERQSDNPHLDGQELTITTTKEAVRELIEFLPYLRKTEKKK